MLLTASEPIAATLICNLPGDGAELYIQCTVALSELNSDTPSDGPLTIDEPNLPEYAGIFILFYFYIFILIIYLSSYVCHYCFSHD